MGPVMPQMQKKEEEKMGLLERLGKGIQNYRSDPEKMARLQMGFNTMRLNPDPNIAASAANTIKTAQAQRQMLNTANVTVQRLRSMGRDDLAQMVEANPAMAKEVVTALATQGLKIGSDTETMRTRKQTATSLGYLPGSDEYNAIISGTTPSQKAKILEDRIGGFRKEYTGNPDTKDFQKVTQAFSKISTIANRENPSAAGDMSLIFNYMKMLDPGSTVREGEYATAQNAASIDQRIINIYNNAVNGQKLNVVQRADFAKTAQEIYDGQKVNDERIRDFYTNKILEISPNYKNALPTYGYFGDRIDLKATSFLPNNFPVNLKDEWFKLPISAQQDYLNFSDEKRKIFLNELQR